MKTIAGGVLFLATVVSTIADPSEDFKDRFNELANEIDEEVQVLRANNSAAILSTAQLVLSVLGNYTIVTRQAFYDTNTTVQLQEWSNESPEAQPCFDFAYVLMELFAGYISFDIGWCAFFAHNELSADAQYHFYSHAHYIMRAGTNGRSSVVESHAKHMAVDDRLAFLQEEYDELKYFWDNYRVVLQQEVEGHKDAVVIIVDDLQICLGTVTTEVQDRLAFVMNNLGECLEGVLQNDNVVTKKLKPMLSIT